MGDDDYIPYQYNQETVAPFNLGESLYTPNPNELFSRSSETNGNLYAKLPSGQYAPALAPGDSDWGTPGKQLTGEYVNYGGRYGTSGPVMIRGGQDQETGVGQYYLGGFSVPNSSAVMRQLGMSPDEYWSKTTPDMRSFFSQYGLSDASKIPTSPEYGAYLPSGLLDAWTSRVQPHHGGFEGWLDKGGGVSAMMGAAFGGAMGGFPSEVPAGPQMSYAPGFDPSVMYRFDPATFTYEAVGSKSAGSAVSPFLAGGSASAPGIFGTGETTGSELADRAIQSGIKGAGQNLLQTGDPKQAAKAALTGGLTNAGQNIITNTPLFPGAGTPAPAAPGIGAQNVDDSDWLSSIPQEPSDFEVTPPPFVPEAPAVNAPQDATFNFPALPRGAENMSVPQPASFGAQGPQMSLMPWAAQSQQAAAPFLATQGGGAPNPLSVSDSADPNAPEVQQGAPVTTGKPSWMAPEKPGNAANVMKMLGLYDPAKGTLGQNVLPLASLGLTAYKQNQQNKQGQTTQEQLNRLSQPAQDASRKLIEEGMAGNVPPAILQQLQTTAQAQKDAIRSRYANMGRDPNNDSAAAAEMAKVDEAMNAQIAQYSSQLLQQGLQAAGVAAGPATAAIQAGVQSDKALQDSMTNAMQQMMLLRQLQQQGNQQGAPAPAAP